MRNNNTAVAGSPLLCIVVFHLLCFFRDPWDNAIVPHVRVQARSSHTKNMLRVYLNSDADEVDVEFYIFCETCERGVVGQRARLLIQQSGTGDLAPATSTSKRK